MDKIIENLTNFLAQYNIDVYEAKKIGDNKATFNVLIYKKKSPIEGKMSVTKAIFDYNDKAKNKVQLSALKVGERSDDEIELSFDVSLQPKATKDSKKSKMKDFYDYEENLDYDVNKDVAWLVPGTGYVWGDTPLESAKEVLKSNCVKISYEEVPEEDLKTFFQPEDYKDDNWYYYDDPISGKDYFPEWYPLEEPAEFLDRHFDSIYTFENPETYEQEEADRLPRFNYYRLSPKKEISGEKSKKDSYPETLYGNVHYGKFEEKDKKQSFLQNLGINSDNVENIIEKMIKERYFDKQDIFEAIYKFIGIDELVEAIRYLFKKFDVAYENGNFVDLDDYMEERSIKTQEKK